MLDKIKCFFLGHDWLYLSDIWGNEYKTCSRCYKTKKRRMFKFWL